MSDHEKKTYERALFAALVSGRSGSMDAKRTAAYWATAKRLARYVAEEQSREKAEA